MEGFGEGWIGFTVGWVHLILYLGALIGFCRWLGFGWGLLATVAAFPLLLMLRSAIESALYKAAGQPHPRRPAADA
jgi:hypothetical protein